MHVDAHADADFGINLVNSVIPNSIFFLSLFSFVLLVD